MMMLVVVVVVVGVGFESVARLDNLETWVFISARRPPILIEGFCGFPQFLRANAETLPLIKP
jgi:hypothetical protein